MVQTQHFNDRFGFILSIAYQSSELCLHHKKIIFHDYFLSLICFLALFLSLSVLSLSTPLHFLVYMTDTSFCPHNHVLALETFFLYTFFFFFFCLNVEIVKHSLYDLTVCFIVQVLPCQLPIHTVLPIMTPFRQHERRRDETAATPQTLTTFLSISTDEQLRRSHGFSVLIF